MAYINRLSDINNKLDTNIENQTQTNDKLANIDDNIATLNTNIKNSFDSTNNALKVNVVIGGGSSDGKALLYNGAGDTAITATTIDTNKNGIDTASSMYVTTSGTRTALTATTVDTDKKGIDTASSMYVTTSGTRTALTATSGALDVNIKSQSNNYLGDFGNILSGISINANSNSSSINITGYSSNSLISYSDTQNLTDTILIFGSLNNSNFFHIGSLLPIYNISLGARYASTKINLAPIKYIRIYNTSSTNITAATCTVVSG